MSAREERKTLIRLIIKLVQKATVRELKCIYQFANALIGTK